MSSARGAADRPCFAAAQRAMEDEAVNARWQADMVAFFELPSGARPDTGFTRLPEIFHLD